MRIRALLPKLLPFSAVLQNTVLRSHALPCGYGYTSTIKRNESKFAGKNVVYVGGYGGIGFAVNKILMCKGIKGLVILDLKDVLEERKALEELNPNVCYGFKKIDLTFGRTSICESIHKAHEKLGSIDIVINGSGLIRDRNPQLVVDVCLMGVIYSVLEVIPLMSKAEGGKGGLIVNISSVLGLEPGHYMAIHSAAKHGIIGLTRCLAHPHYYKHTGIAHMVLCPGPTKSGSVTILTGVDTFDYSAPILAELKTIKSQSVDECAKNMVEAIEEGQNNDCWIIDLGKKEKVKFHTYWKYTHKEQKK